MTLRILPEAEAEIGEAAHWYESKRAGLGAEFVAVVDTVFEAIVEAPRASPVWKPKAAYRRAALRRFPYVVFFHIVDGDVEVVAVAHAKRRPGYWLARRG